MRAFGHRRNDITPWFENIPRWVVGIRDHEVVVHAVLRERRPREILDRVVNLELGVPRKPLLHGPHDAPLVRRAPVALAVSNAVLGVFHARRHVRAAPARQRPFVVLAIVVAREHAARPQHSIIRLELPGDVRVVVRAVQVDKVNGLRGDGVEDGRVERERLEEA